MDLFDSKSSSCHCVSDASLTSRQHRSTAKRGAETEEQRAQMGRDQESKQAYYTLGVKGAKKFTD